MSLGFDRPYPPDPKRYRVDQDEYVTGNLVLQSGATLGIQNAALYNNAPVGGKFLQLGSDGTVGCSAGGAGSGSVTSITAGTGLTGGTITSAGTITTNLTAGANVTITPGTGTELVIAATGGGGGGITTVAAGNGITVAGGTGPTATVTNNIVAGSGISISGTNPLTIAATGGGSSLPLTIPTPGGLSVSKKSIALAANSATTLASISGAGIVRNIWVALATVDPRLCYFRGTFDGAGSPQIGTSASSGTAGQVLTCHELFTNGFSNATTGNDFTITNPVDGTTNHPGFTWATNISGSAMGTVSGGFIVSGYYRMDMPYSTSFSFSIYNNSGVTGVLYYKIDYDTGAVSDLRRMFVKPFYYPSFNSSTTVWQELPLMTTLTAGASGAVLKGFKFSLSAPRGQGATEGRVRVYTGGSGMTANQAPTTYTYTGSISGGTESTNLCYYVVTGGGTVISAWTGTEDAFQNAQTWSGLPLYATDLYGTVASFFDGTNYNLTCYRYFTDTSPGVTNGNSLSVSWVPGDPEISGGSGTLTGVCFYYA